MNGRTRKEIMADINYDEAKVPSYELPELLTDNEGNAVTTAMDWMSHRRGEILDMYRKYSFGKTPRRPDGMRFELLSCKDDAFGGLAIRKEIRIHLTMNDGRDYSFDMLLYIPSTATPEHPVPCFLGLNFRGNHTTTTETDARFSGDKMPEWAKKENAQPHGGSAHRWLFEETVRHGFASATICYHDILPDHGSLAAFAPSVLSILLSPAEMERCHKDYSAIGVWSWGLSRALDCLESEPLIDAARVAVHGHSRLGKTALWAGATDPRFQLVISNCSGCGGAALYRRCFGESTEWIYDMFPSWFVEDFEQFINNETALPFDQHFLIALSAPRRVCVASALEDAWADPKGEFEAARLAAPVYELFGSKGLPASEMPALSVRVSGDVSYHIRPGRHDQILEDWEHYWELAKNL